MTMNFSSTGTPKSPLNGHNTEPSPRLNIHSPIIIRQAPPPPAQFEPSHNMTQYPPMNHTIARPTASPPPPPSPPPLPLTAPPLPVNMGIPTLATISEIDCLPPPPADFIQQSPPLPPPPMLTNTPPGSPLPNSTIQSLVMRPPTENTTTPARKSNSDSNHGSSSQFDDISITSETSIQDQRPYIMRDLHSDLLDEIKKGIQLNNRKKEEEKKAATVVKTKTGSLDVMAIMEQVANIRRRMIRPQLESENEDESSRCDDSE
jgi:hypothetical protein